MSGVKQCAKCGVLLPEDSGQKCPLCGTAIAAPARRNLWRNALIQVVFSTTFMLLFRFPRVLIVAFSGLILLFTALASLLRPKAAAASVRMPSRPAKHPALVRLLEGAIALCAVVGVSIALFSAVILANAWMRWQQFKGLTYHQTEFRVVRVSIERPSTARGSPVLTASGLVDGEQEKMNLRPYLRMMPYDQSTLEQMVPAGTSIPVYLFSGLKGKMRVQLNNGPPPAEAASQAATSVVRNGCLGLAMCCGVLFVLIRLRRMCLAEPETMDGISAQPSIIGSGT